MRTSARRWADASGSSRPAASAVKSLLRNFFPRPGESMQQAQALVSDMVDAMLADKDVVLDPRTRVSYFTEGSPSGNRGRDRFGRLPIAPPTGRTTTP